MRKHSLELKESDNTNADKIVNVWGIVHWKGVYRVREWTLAVQSFFNWLLKLTKQKRQKRLYV